MKPLELKLQAFGSFAKEITIDFTELSKDGVFLIVGETGSGKTTIFDAICYALYGEANGSDRDVKEFRSQFADENTPTYVQLKFEHQGKEYTAYMSPTSSKVCIKDYDGNILAQKKKETCKFVENLIGLTAEQFKQIVMIAQGEFKAFLLAKSDDKSKILNKVFNTQKFVDFKEILKRKVEQYRRDYYNYYNIVMGKVHSIRYDNSSAYANELDTLKTPNHGKHIQVVLELIDKLIKELQETQTKVDGNFKVVNSQCDELSKRVNEANTVNENIRKRDETLSKLENLKRQESIIADYQREIEMLKVAKSLEPNLSNYLYVGKEAQKLQRDIEVLKVNLNENSQKMEQLKAKLHTIEENYPTSDGEVLDYINERVGVQTTELKAITERGKDLKSILDSLDDYTNQLKELSVLQELSQHTAQQELNAKAYYNDQRNKFMSNLAGIVAEQLVEGCECPVCGSKEHPKVAQRCEGSITKEDLERLQKELENVTANAKKAQSNAERQSAKVEQLHENIMERVGKYGITDAKQVRQQVSDMKNSLAEEFTAINCEIKTLQKTAEEVRNVKDGLNNLNISVSNIETTITDKKTQLETTSSEYTRLKDKYFKLLEKNSIKDANAHLQLLSDYGRCTSLERQVQSYHVEKSTNLQLLDEYSKLVGDKVLIDTTELVSRLNSLNAQRDTLLAQSSNLHDNIQTNTTIHTEVSSMVDTLETYRKRYRDTEYLSGVANGTLSSGNGKVAFDGYVQAYYFEQVLECANHKIQTMSSGRYTLTRKEVATGNATRTNLDIEVFDAYTCTKRSASTLSGGESFMASLSLALGLSEIVQNSSGGIQIDAMFIDEGFGTLDSDLSLQQAMKILDNLANGERVVGIISHVGDLQEHINRKLYVEKTPNGSFVRNGF